MKHTYVLLFAVFVLLGACSSPDRTMQVFDLTGSAAGSDVSLKLAVYPNGFVSGDVIQDGAVIGSLCGNLHEQRLSVRVKAAALYPDEATLYGTFTGRTFSGRMSVTRTGEEIGSFSLERDNP